MRRRLAVAALLVTLAAITVIWARTEQAGCNAVPAGGVIQRAGRYCLNSSRSLSHSPGIDIAAPNVILDLRGGRLIYRGQEARSVGIFARPDATGARVVGGIVEGFAIGVEQGTGRGLRVEGVTLRRIGFIGMLVHGDGARLTGNTVEEVGTAASAPDNAYAIGANLTGRDVLFQKNVIRDVHRQTLDRKIVGEAVGVLIGDECLDCVVADNQIAKLEAEERSIGVWNSGTGKVEIRRNRLNGFSQGIVSLGHQYVIHGNEIGCMDSATSTGLVMSLGRSSAGDGEGSAIANKYSTCAVEQMICNNGCKAVWSMDLAQRLWRESKRDR